MNKLLNPNIFTFGFPALLAWTAAYSVYEPLTYLIIPAISESKTVKTYYDPKKIPFGVVVFGDYIYSTFLLLVAQVLITAVKGAAAPTGLTDWFQRFLMFVGVQWAGDLTFYNIIKNAPPLTRYIKFFQDYTSEVGVWAAIGDSVYGLFWFALTQIFASSVPAVIQMALICLFMFLTLVLSF
jgi:hypothetical protein